EWDGQTSVPWFQDYNQWGSDPPWNYTGEYASFPDLTLPASSSAREAGIDLSKPFSFNGIDYPPLPGMLPGYFAGNAPDIGAVQTGVTPSTSAPPPNPTAGLRRLLH